MQGNKNHVVQVYRIERAAPSAPAVPVIYDSPHSGRLYPEDFDYECDTGLMTRAEDNHVDDLLSGCTDLGIPLLCAEFPRTYIDLNRATDDIEPQQICDNNDLLICNPSDKGQAGIGLIRRDIKPGIPVYRTRPTATEIKRRIEAYYDPYHQALSGLIDETARTHGYLWHINWHSMPSLGSVTPLPRLGRPQRRGQPDFVLGDRHGTTCWPVYTNKIKMFLSDLGYVVDINDPYKGAEIVRRHSNPLQGLFSLQIEINKGLYWDERKMKKNSYFSLLKDDLQKLSSFLITLKPDTGSL